MKRKLLSFIFIIFLSLAILGACSNTENKKSDSNHNSDNSMNMDHSSMNMSGDGELPKGLKKAENPKYKVGDKVALQADHMEGMKGAKGTVSGAFDTTVYAVSYTPVDDGEPVKNHKWVIHEELKEADKQPFKQGDSVTLKTDHMKGMDGAEAKIDTAEQTTVYIVDYKDEKTGKEVKNHKWVTESELSVE